MRFMISRLELIDLLTRVQGIVPQKPTIPILSNVLIEASNDELIFTATDLTVGIRCFTDTKVLEEGSTTLPVKKFLQLVRELTAVNLEISTDESNISEITADSSNFKLRGMSSQEYPSLPDLEGSNYFPIPQKDLKEQLNATAFAVSREDNRYVLTGVLMQLGENTVTFVGTDGKRLARTFKEISLPENITGSHTIPFKAVEEIIKNLHDDADEPAKVHLFEDRIAIETDQSVVVTKLLSGEYPDYNLIIPEKSEKVMTLHRDELITLLRQISLFTSGEQQSVRFSFSDGELNVFANAAEIGEAKVSMPVNFHGDKLEIAFHPSFFLDILRNCKNEAITFGCTDRFTPGVITDQEDPQVHPQHPSPLYVLMPMRIKEE